MQYQKFLSENFHFLVVKFSVHLNWHVFLMALPGAMIQLYLPKVLGQIYLIKQYRSRSDDAEGEI